MNATRLSLRLVGGSRFIASTVDVLAAPKAQVIEVAQLVCRFERAGLLNDLLKAGSHSQQVYRAPRDHKDPNMVRKIIEYGIISKKPHKHKDPDSTIWYTIVWYRAVEVLY